MEINLTGQRALVTGGSGGIGRAIVEDFAACGATVRAVGTDATKLAALQASLPGVEIQRLDLSDKKALDEACTGIGAARYDIVVNCAGINALAKVGNLDFAALDNIMTINFRSAATICNAVVEGMARRKYGRIVNITSVFSHVSKSGRASYTSSKFALDGFTKALALDFADQGVLANCVAPGFIGTELTRRILGEEGMREMTAKVPVGRMGEPKDVSPMVAFLASPLNSFITGQNILVDGGFTTT